MVMIQNIGRIYSNF